MGENINLFKFAPGELTNDAMICWLINLFQHEKIEYRNLSRDIINLFTRDNINIINKIEILQQYKRIDILVKVNDDELIIIEDKVNSSEHNNQLEKYVDEIENDNDDDIKNRKKNYVYLKLGNESNYQNKIICYKDKEYLNDKQYYYVSRKMLLDILSKYRHLKNDILKDYIEYLEEKERLFNKYKESDKLEQWSWGWEGYFAYLQEKKNIKKKCWGYVTNSSGGFLGFWWNFIDKEYVASNDEKIPYLVYLQIEVCPWKNKLEVERVAIKVSCEDVRFRSEIRNYIWNHIKEILTSQNDFTKTNFKPGRYMTICEYRSSTKSELESSITRGEELLSNLIKVL